MEKPLKILILEDCATDAEIIVRLLKKEQKQYECFVTMNKKEFSAALTHFNPDVILSDNSLPQFCAADALEIVGQRSMQIPFILVTGTVSEEYAAGIIKQGADDYILKDRLTRLPASIDMALRQRQAEKEKKDAAERLKHSEENYRSIMERVSDGFVALNKDWCYTYVNKKAGEILYRDPAHLIGKHIWTEFRESMGPDQPFYKAFHHAMDEQQYTHIEEYYASLNLWLESDIYPSPDGLSIFFRDITKRKKAERQLKASFGEKQDLAKRMSAILNTLAANIALLDEKGIIADVNDAWRNFTDENGFVGPEYRIGDNYIDISRRSFCVAKEEGKKIANGIKSVLQKKSEEFEFEYSCDSRDSKRWYRMVVTPLQGKEYTGAVVMHIDISELRRLEDERLRNKMEEQKKITRAMLEGQEKERNQIGRDLHDNISQLLAAIKMKLGFYLKKPHHENGPAILDQCMEHTQEAMIEIRNLSHQMVMPRFAEDSFQQALEQLIANYSHAKRIIKLATGHLKEKDVPALVKETLYRIVQEQLNNIEKYAKASDVTIQVCSLPGSITLIIADNGVGFDVKKKRGGIGLTNIMNRAESYNGAVTIFSEPGNGCKLTVEIPLMRD